MASPSADEQPYDSVILVSFGGPEGPQDVVPFLQNVTRGRDIPAARLAEVAANYDAFGGRSPINEHNRALLAALRAELDRAGRGELRLYWGNRNWHPFLADTVGAMADEGCRRALAFVTSAYSSYSSCRQYLDDLAAAQAAVGPGAPRIDKLRPFFNHPGFIEAQVASVQRTLGGLTGEERSRARLLFSAHSIPAAQAATCDYEAQLGEVARLVVERLDRIYSHELVWQSRSGPPQVPWLEPDINQRLRELGAAGGDQVAVVVPVGFVADHMEVVYDLDTQARATAASAGVTLRRAPTVGADPRFVTMVRELIEEQLPGGTPGRALGGLGVRLSPCRTGCCPPPTRPGGPRAAR